MEDLIASYKERNVILFVGNGPALPPTPSRSVSLNC